MKTTPFNQHLGTIRIEERRGIATNHSDLLSHFTQTKSESPETSKQSRTDRVREETDKLYSKVVNCKWNGDMKGMLMEIQWIVWSAFIIIKTDFYFIEVNLLKLTSKYSCNKRLFGSSHIMFVSSFLKYLFHLCLFSCHLQRMAWWTNSSLSLSVYIWIDHRTLEYLSALHFVWILTHYYKIWPHTISLGR